jgi:uncharacterized protein involved in cysteine biosynthesis
MEKLRLNEYLRYGLSGAVALLTLVLTYPQTASWLSIDSKLAQAFIVVGLILLIGILIYSVHRAILYPIIYRIMLTKIHGFEWKSLSLLPWKFSSDEIELDVKRSNKRCEEKNPYKTGFDEWFSRIHFLYCSAWAILISLILGYVIKPCAALSKTALLIFVLVCLLAFISALFDDIHAMKVEKEVLNNHSNKQ